MWAQAYTEVLILSVSWHHYITQTISHNDRQCSAHFCSNLLSWTSHILVQCTAVNVRFSLAVFLKKMVEMFCFSSQTHVTSNKHTVHCMSNFCK